MVRRIASQVHKQVSRLMRVNYIKDEPVWYQAVLQFPPLPLPPKSPPFRQDGARHSKLVPPKHKPVNIAYLEDEVRRQFFRDHPFEAFRPVSIVEGGVVTEEHPVQGKDWIRLSQRGRCPSPEDAVRFAVNLHKHHKVSLTVAYTRAVAEFRALRAEHDIASSFSRMEAEAYGAVFPSEVDRTFQKEDMVYKAPERKRALDEGALLARKRWRAILSIDSGMGNTWSRGHEYAKLQDQGIRPRHTYLDKLSNPSSLQQEIASPATDSQSANPDFLRIL
ncbi:mitochondrial ribosomal protein S25-domain-containing protein [Pisolithus orientalis]|uniref:mitochondrial ribosomal protein S25-domain-containing protein n=1 Tax=Pisolithus orientalis TaxID=936130 RepID=UPI0022253209|nr:mitochondrial ribosomal protein S25-domain-containing protein [Pisolithus orientalis]KAI6008355.1 mitochondrial ribosomal protein S25-domain-containing protein [Pisolithus orientalis]